MAKVRYEVDPHNRLIIAGTGKRSGVPEYRHVAEGSFKVSRNNSLTYHIKKSRHSDIPQQVRFSGNWSLDRNNDLVLTLNKWNNQVAGNKLVIKGRVLDVKGNRLLFSVTTKKPDGRSRIYNVGLSGSWRADEANRLSFKIDKEKGSSDTLTLEGVWEINRRGALAYRYTKGKRAYGIVLEGHWEASDRLRLLYAFGKNTITIGGRWRIDEKKGLIFEIKYKDGGPRAIVFGCALKLTGGNSLEARLRNEMGEGLGVKLTLSKKFLRGRGERFLKALASKREVVIHAGIGIVW